MRLHITIPVVAILFVVTFGLVNTAYADAALWDAETFICNVDEANGLHITYYSDTILSLKDHIMGPFTEFTAEAVDPPNNKTWECKWSGTSVDMGEAVHVGVKFSQSQKAELKKSDIHWSMDGTPSPDFLPGVGFKVEPWAGAEGDPLQAKYTITNSSGITFTAEDIILGYSPYETALYLMTYPVDLPPDGSFISVGPVTLGPGESWSQEFLRPKSTTTGFFLAEGLIKVDGNIVGNFVQQHQQHFWYPAPSLTNWGLAILLALLVLSGIIVIRQRRKGVARA